MDPPSIPMVGGFSGRNPKLRDLGAGDGGGYVASSLESSPWRAMMQLFVRFPLVIEDGGCQGGGPEWSMFVCRGGGLGTMPGSGSTRKGNGSTGSGGNYVPLVWQRCRFGRRAPYGAV